MSLTDEANKLWDELKFPLEPSPELLKEMHKERARIKGELSALKIIFLTFYSSLTKEDAEKVIANFSELSARQFLEISLEETMSLEKLNEKFPPSLPG